MNKLLLHSRTRQALESFLIHPFHALMLVGPEGSGKQTLACQLAENLLDLAPGDLEDYPYGLVVAPEAGKTIGIEIVRSLDQFLALKVPGKQPIDRVVVIADAHMMTAEAQNALLKTLEEPPRGTVLLLTVAYEQAVLPTIRSRAQTVTLGPLKEEELKDYFADQGYKPAAIAQAYAMSGGLPGLMHALLHDEDHPLLLATRKARELLAQTQYERLLSVDELAKQKKLALDVTFILQQMAHIRLQTATDTAARKWQAILEAAYVAAEALDSSAQPKLVLAKLMLTL